MFKEIVTAGEALIQRLEANTIQARQRLSAAGLNNMVSFKELESWKRSASDTIRRVLGSHPQSRFDYIWGLFDEEWNRVRGPSDALTLNLNGAASCVYRKPYPSR